MLMQQLLAVQQQQGAYARHEALRRLGRRCPDLNGEPCWYCEEEEGDRYFNYEDWEGSSEEAAEEEEEDEDNQEEKVATAAAGAGRSASPATFCGFKRSFLCKPSAAPAPASSSSSSPDCPLLGIAVPLRQQLTAEEAQRNAEELVAEEERVKKKAEKKRMKKKRQKDRKRQEKREQQLQAGSSAQAEASPHSPGAQEPDPLAALPRAVGPALPGSEESSTQDPSESLASPGRSPSRSTEEETEEELDLTSTFVSKARLKVGTKPPLPRKEKAARPEAKERQELPRPGLQMPPVEQSLVLADCGNETAKRGCYREAVLLFTEAVKLNPREYRFFGNRSFCYERLQCYMEALCDAQLALSLQPGWPKGLFRQGKALMGLKRFAEAARTFEELLRLDGSRSDAAVQLEKCRIQFRLENGFSQYHPPEWGVVARDARLLLPGDQRGGRPAGAGLASVTITSSKCKAAAAAPLPPPPAAHAPAREWFAVWVGNLTPRITQEVLLHYFRPFGPIDSIRRLPRKFCAFVNYTRREAAEEAYKALQGAEVEGARLLLQLKHPVHATPAPAKAPSSF
ncbi:tetratricopeptide repeat protein 31 [Hemicordylus capensis]|uniref:tetratricopeptide repeat protein 31 n=1 Tax=Hemicordylus capensis TaxID=884348 RepID=UPI002302F4FE|nr:tetratricopeptide repeat protein 31 [Hemicordylus capensis]